MYLQSPKEFSLIETLMALGLSEQEAKIYLFLAKQGPQKAKDITKFLGTNKVLVYRSVKRLQAKNLIASSVGFPAYFSAIPFLTVLNNLIQTKKREAFLIERNKETLIATLKSLEIAKSPSLSEMFAIITDLHIACIKAIQIARTAKYECLAMDDNLTTSSHDAIEDVGEMARHAIRDKVRFRFITNVTPRTIGAAKDLVKKCKMNNKYVEGRHVDLSPVLFPRFALNDENQTILVVETWEEIVSKHNRRIDKLLWTNNKTIIRLMRFLFEDIWRRSIDINKRISELENNN